MKEYLASLDDVEASAKSAWNPPPKLTVSQWADAHYFMSPENSASPGKWTTLPYQRGWMDAVSDPAVEQVVVMKSARVGYTQSIGGILGYHMHYDPCPMTVVQPTIDTAKTYSKEFIGPMIRDTPALAKITFEDMEEKGPSGASPTMLHKLFPGGVLSLIGANSGAGFRMVSRRVMIFDEPDAYPGSAGSDGDQVELGKRRTEAYWNRKIIAGCTPLIAGLSRIEGMYESGDRRRYFVPCPQCGHMAPLVFRESDSLGHWMQFDKENPEGACFICRANGCVIEHRHKIEMVAAGEWRSARPFHGVASFHIWAAYSPNINASWGQIAAEWIAANKGGPEKLKTFVNTVLGETWKERGEAPDWERLYARRETYQIGTVPEGVQFLTAGIDVQRDRWVYEVVGWGEGKESWSVDSGVIPGKPENEAEWAKLDEFLNRTYGNGMPASIVAIDSGDNTQMVYAWARRHVGRVIAVKGQASARVILGAPSPVDVTIRGKRIARGCKVWSVGSDIAKVELYGWLRLPVPIDGSEHPNGFCHFPEYGPDYFEQLTGEHLVTDRNRKGYTTREWQVIPGRENHFLDCRVYARAAASLYGLDRQYRRPATAPVAPVPAQPRVPEAPAEARPTAKPRTDSRFLSGNRRGKNWLSSKR